MLTDAQKLILKADILADSILNAFPMTTDGAYGIGQLYDAIAVPEFVVWKTSVTVEQIMVNGFIWTYVDNMTIGKARIWEWLTHYGSSNQYGSLNPSKANVRAGIDEAFKGTAEVLAAREAVYVHCRRPATRGEKLFATGTGTTASPALMVVEDSIFYMDIFFARQM